MNNFIYIFFNYFFLVFHTVFLIFNIFGWIFKKLRRIHFITIFITLFSWVVLGLKYGMGYCFCTDWHWQVREELGFSDHSYSYIHFLILELTGIDFNEEIIINLTWAIFSLLVVLTVLLNLRDYIKEKR